MPRFLWQVTYTPSGAAPVSAASLSIHTTASGAARTEAIPLLTPDRMDKATSAVESTERRATI